MLVRGFRLPVLAALLLACALATPALSEPPPPEEPGWAFSILGGAGGGGRHYDVRIDTSRSWEDADSFINQGQWFVDARVHAPPIDILGKPRPFVIGGYTRAFGNATETFAFQNDIGRGQADATFVDRWTVGAGLSFPVVLSSGRTLMEVNPWIGYGQERGTASFTAVTDDRFFSADPHQKIHQVVPGLEFSFPVAPLGSFGQLHLAIGAQAPIDVGGDDDGSAFVQFSGNEFLAIDYDRSRVGWAAYGAIRLVFGGL